MGTAIRRFLHRDGLMRGIRPTRRRRAERSLPGVAQTAVSAQGLRSLYCLDMRALEQTWQDRPLRDLRTQCKGGRLSALLSDMDLDPRHSLERNVRGLSGPRMRILFDALCEELAEFVLHDIPEVAWRALLPLVCPQRVALSPYPDGLEAEGGIGEGLVLLVEGKNAAELASQICGRAHTPSSEFGPIDRAFWSYVIKQIMGMLDAVRERGRALLMDVD